MGIGRAIFRENCAATILLIGAADHHQIATREGQGISEERRTARQGHQRETAIGERGIESSGRCVRVGVHRRRIDHRCCVTRVGRLGVGRGCIGALGIGLADDGGIGARTRVHGGHAIQRGSSTIMGRRIARVVEDSGGRIASGGLRGYEPSDYSYGSDNVNRRF